MRSREILHTKMSKHHCSHSYSSEQPRQDNDSHISIEPRQLVKNEEKALQSKVVQPSPQSPQKNLSPSKIRITSPSRVQKMQKSLKKLTIKKRDIYASTKVNDKVRSMPVDSDTTLPKTKVSDSNLTSATQETGKFTQRKPSFLSSQFGKHRASIVRKTSRNEKSTFCQSGQM